MWAALVAIADQLAVHPLGNLNAALYRLATNAHAGDFRDVTSGSNAHVGDGVSVSGYDAGTGWDAVTGLAPLSRIV